MRLGSTSILILIASSPIAFRVASPAMHHSEWFSNTFSNTIAASNSGLRLIVKGVRQFVDSLCFTIYTLVSPGLTLRIFLSYAGLSIYCYYLDYLRY
jgi:hypothetical protein